MDARMTPPFCMRAFFTRASRVAVLLAAFALPAHANQPPGPHMLLAEILILPVMMLLTAAGGASALVHPKPAGRRWLAPTLAVLAIFLSGISEGYGLLVTIIFGAIAVARGVRMLYWGATAAKPAGQEKPASARARMVFSGSALVVVAVALAGVSFAFVGWWAPTSYVEDDIRRVVAFQLAWAEQHQDAERRPQYAAPTLDDSQPFPEGPRTIWLRASGNRSYFASRFQLRDDGQGFQFWVWPERMPFFPYNYLVSLPSFYADETGQLRMVRVHHARQRCPPDAPVYMRVTAAEWKSVE